MAAPAMKDAGGRFLGRVAKPGECEAALRSGGTSLSPAPPPEGEGFHVPVFRITDTGLFIVKVAQPTHDAPLPLGGGAGERDRSWPSPAPFIGRGGHWAMNG